MTKLLAPGAIQAGYFSGLASFPRPSRADLELQMGMVRTNQKQLTDLAASLVQRAATLKGHREGVSHDVPCCPCRRHSRRRRRRRLGP